VSQQEPTGRLQRGSPRTGRYRRKSPSPATIAALCVFVLASLLVTQQALGATAPAPPSGASPTDSPGPPPVVTPPPKPVAPLFHPVGCARRGSGPYFHGLGWRKAVALTFDDGPWADTPAFVRMLEHWHVPATFFMIGQQVTSRQRALLRRELRDGDALGDHSWSHPDLTHGGAYQQLRRTKSAIRSLTGYTPCVFRPPYGSFNREVVSVARSLDLATIMWDVDPTDWARPGAERIGRRVLAEVRSGSIILSHDGGGPRGETLAAYPHIINVLKHRGYRFLTVPQLLGFQTLYRRCEKHCEGAGVTVLPPGSAIAK
jgi:peptidoglycan-N-acetylglucosamine deacetylase